MNRTFFKIGFGLLGMAGLVLAADAAAPAGARQLSGHVPAVVSHLSAKGQMGATNTLNLAIGLPVRNAAALTNLLQRLYDPASPDYHHFLTTAEFTAQFGPTEQDYQAAADFAKANGLEVTGTHPNRMVLDVRGRVSDVERAFNVTLKTYRHPTEPRDFFAPDVEPTPNTGLSILHVSGLDNYAIPHPHLKPMPALQPAGENPGAGSGPQQSYQGSDFRKAYVPGSTLTGAGQNVGLLQFDGFYTNDIAAYASQIGLASVPQVVVVPVDGGVLTPTLFGNPEVSLDIEMILSMSPGVSKIYVYEAPNPSPWEDLLSRMANDNVAKQLSCSWGGGYPDATAEQIFQQMALQGQSFYNAVGDSDAFVGGDISFPSDSPHITQVGGTTLTTTTNSYYISETVWNWDVEYGTNNDGAGSSGGISTYYTIPSWQTNVSMTANGGSTTMRNVPDVALTADHVWVIYGSGSSDWFGGTSCAAPLWAGYTALVNQQAVANGHSTVGFINPAIYAIATGTNNNYTNCFHDTTTGNNEWSASPNLFRAVTNYDLCTGLGTPNGTNLINALAGAPSYAVVISAPLPPWGTNLAVMKGTDPNGPWFLFIQDTKAPYGGEITNGWFVTLTTANPVGNVADNQLYVTPVNQSLLPGKTWSFTLSVTNYGPSVSSNVYVTNSLPDGLTLITNTLPTNVLVGTRLIWNVGTLTTNAGASLTLSFTNGSAGTTYTNSAGVASDYTSDPNPDDDTIAATVVYQPAIAPNLAAFSYTRSGGFQFSVTNSPGQSVIIQASTNLVSWITVYTNVEPFTYANTNTTSFPMRFYRAVTGQ
jgi:uncharacterized repeat protein (TIGR01451 family)